jgi:peptidoglycan/LPS O-acetylase OafA/YrhL
MLYCWVYCCLKLRLSTGFQMPFSLLRTAATELINPPKQTIASLDVLRSIAIGLVVVGHVGSYYDQGLWVQKLPFIYWGWTGVDLFFVLSGFFIGRMLWRELKASGTIDLPAFILRRGLRIWPYYYAVLLFLAVTALLSGEPLSCFAADTFFVSNYFHHCVSGGWSLSTEEQFYIVTPLALLAASRVLPPQFLILVPVIWLLSLPIIRAVDVSMLSGPVPKNYFYFPFHVHSDGLAAGLILAWITVFKPSLMTGGITSNLTLLGVSGAVGGALLAWNREVFNFFSLALVFSSLAFVLLRSTWLPSFTQSIFFHVVARLSYAMYLNHFSVLPRVSFLVQKVAGTGAVSFAIAAVAGVAASMALAYITFALIELPWLEWRDKLLAERERRRAPDVAPSLTVDRHGSSA